MTDNSNKNKNIHAGHRQRMFEKFKRGGIQAFEDHEMLEILLYYSNPRSNTNPIAHDLIERFGSLAGVLEADMHDLIKVKGVGKRTAELIHFTHELFGIYLQRKNEFPRILSSANLIIEFLLSMYIGKTKEEIGVLTLDGKMCYKSFHVIQTGSPDSVSVNIRNIAEVALGDNAIYVVICHNHPDGLAFPSENDVMVTIAIIKALYAIGIIVLDHVIIAGTEHISMVKSPQYKKYFIGNTEDKY